MISRTKVRPNHVGLGYSQLKLNPAGYRYSSHTGHSADKKRTNLSAENNFHVSGKHRFYLKEIVCV